MRYPIKALPPIGAWFACCAVTAGAMLCPAEATAYDACKGNCELAGYRCKDGDYDYSRSSGCAQEESICKMQCDSQESTGRVPRYGAIAYSQSDRAQGFSWDFGDRASAEAAALKECRQRTGSAANCRIVTWFSNNCGALATASNGAWGAGYAGNQSGAQGQARQICRNHGGPDCAVQRSFCSGR